MKKLLVCAAIFSIAATSFVGCSKERKERSQQENYSKFPDDDSDDEELIEEDVEIEAMGPIHSQNINQSPIRHSGQRINQNPVQQTSNQKLNQNPIRNPVQEYNKDKNRIPNSNQR